MSAVPALAAPANVLALQRSAGNQAVARALTAARAPSAPGGRSLARAGTTWDKSDDTIWVKDPGTRYEEQAFEGVDGREPAANIAGNFPIIDDFSGGVATSLKTIDIVSRYQGEPGLTSLGTTVRGYLNDLALFSGRTHSGTTVNREDISELVLKIAIPPEPAEGAPGYADRKALVERIAAAGVRSDMIAINRENERPKAREAKSAYTDPGAYAPSKKRGRDPVVEEEPAKTANKTITLRAVVEVVAGIWGDVPGRRYEKDAFGGKNPAANIGGNFPTIDDLRGGVATSLKTINIVERFAGPKQVTKLIEEYIQELGTFNGRTWPAGPRPSVPAELLSEDKKSIVVKPEDIDSLKLQIAIPPVTKILRDKKAELRKAKGDAKDRLREEIEAIEAKYDAVMEFDGEQYTAGASDKDIVIVIEERD